MTPEPLALPAETLAQLTLDTNPWLSCDDCFDQVDRYAEHLVLGSGGLPAAFRAHLRGCPVCLEEARSLVALVAVEAGRPAAASLTRLEDAVLVGGESPF
jgi:hypothetical protein